MEILYMLIAPTHFRDLFVIFTFLLVTSSIFRLGLLVKRQIYLLL